MDDLIRNLLIGRYWRLYEIIKRLNNAANHIYTNRELGDYDVNAAYTIIDACRMALISEKTLIHARLGFAPMEAPSSYRPFWNEINWGYNPERG